MWYAYLKTGNYNHPIDEATSRLDLEKKLSALGFIIEEIDVTTFKHHSSSRGDSRTRKTPSKESSKTTKLNTQVRTLKEELRRVQYELKQKDSKLESIMLLVITALKKLPSSVLEEVLK